MPAPYRQTSLLRLPSWLALLLIVACGIAGAGEAWIPLGYLGTAPAAGSVTGVKAIAAGGQTVLALKQDGRVVSWGSYPYDVPAAAQSGVSAIAHGAFASLAVKDGGVIQWGGNYYVVPIEATHDVQAVAAGGDHFLAMKAGQVIAWGSNSFTESDVPAGLVGVTAIAAGFYHSLALSGGSVSAWGWNAQGQCSVPTAATSGVSAVAAGVWCSLALKNGGVIMWGDSAPAVPEMATHDVTAIAAGAYHVLALQGGSVIAFGDNYFGQCDVPAAATSGVMAIAAASNYSVAVKDDGTVITWGYSDEGAVTVPSFISGCDQMEQDSSQLLARTGGTVNRWGSDFNADLSDNPYHEPLPAGTANGVTALAVGSGHHMALKNQTIIAWGYSSFSQNVIPADAASGVDAIAEGGQHSLALVGGKVVAWGRNVEHQTDVPNAGDDDATSGVTAIAAGFNHALALKGGRVIAWGSNDYGQSSVPTLATSGIIAIDSGTFHSVALSASHQVLAWGYDNGGISTVPAAAASGVVAIAAGGNHTIALKDDTSIVLWGQNEGGASAQSELVDGVSDIAAGDAQTWVRRAGRLPATITLTDRIVTVDGSPKGLDDIHVAGVGGIDPPVNCTFNGSSTYPSTAGVYTVVATVDCAGYTGTATATLMLVNPGGQVINFHDPSPGSHPYGSSISLTATASSGLPVSFHVVSGGASLQGSLLTFTSSSGTVVVQADQAGDATYAAATPVQISLATCPATLTVTAEDLSMAVGGSLPTLTWHASGFAFSENLTNLTGTPLLSTAATSSSPTGSYPITVSVSGVSAPNYTIVPADGTLTIRAGSTGGNGGGGGGGGGGCGAGATGMGLILSLCVGLRRRKLRA